MLLKLTGAKKIRRPAKKNTTTQKQLETNNKVWREVEHQAAVSLIIRDHDDIRIIIMPGDFLHRVAVLMPNIARTCPEKASVLLTFMDSR